MYHGDDNSACDDNACDDNVCDDENLFPEISEKSKKVGKSCCKREMMLQRKEEVLS